MARPFFVAAMSKRCDRFFVPGRFGSESFTLFPGVYSRSEYPTTPPPLVIAVPSRVSLYRTLRVLIVLFLMPSGVQAQQAEPASTTSAWERSLVTKLAGSQATFQNWAEGGINTLALSSAMDGRWQKNHGRWNRRYDLRLAFGAVKQDTLDFRKAEDIIRLQATYKHTGLGSLSAFMPTAAFTVRSQMAPGYNFEKNQFKERRPLPQKVSDLLSPGVMSVSFGMTYQHKPWLSQRVGLGGKQTVVLIERLRELYSMTADQGVRMEVGLEAYTEFERDVARNVHMKSTLGLFAAFNQPEHPDLLWENLLTMKVNSWLQFNVEWVVLRDKDVSNRFQLKEVFTVGIVYTILK